MEYGASLAGVNWLAQPAAVWCALAGRGWLIYQAGAIPSQAFRGLVWHFAPPIGVAVFKPDRNDPFDNIQVRRGVRQPGEGHVGFDLVRKPAAAIGKLKTGGKISRIPIQGWPAEVLSYQHGVNFWRIPRIPLRPGNE